MKLNDKGMAIPDTFLVPFHGTRQEAMEQYYPDKGEWSFPPEDEFRAELGEQDWMGLIATQGEVGILQKILRGEELTEEERDFSLRLADLIDVAWKDQEKRREAS